MVGVETGQRVGLLEELDAGFARTKNAVIVNDHRTTYQRAITLMRSVRIVAAGFKASVSSLMLSNIFLSSWGPAPTRSLLFAGPQPPLGTDAPQNLSGLNIAQPRYTRRKIATTPDIT